MGTKQYTCILFAIPFLRRMDTIHNTRILFTLSFLRRMDITHIHMYIICTLLPSTSGYNTKASPITTANNSSITLSIHHPHTHMQFTSTYTFRLIESCKIIISSCHVFTQLSDNFSRNLIVLFIHIVRSNNYSK